MAFVKVIISSWEADNLEEESIINTDNIVRIIKADDCFRFFTNNTYHTFYCDKQEAKKIFSAIGVSLS